MNQSVAINMRAELQSRDLIDRAAQLLRLNRTEFVLNTAVRRAQEVILDQQLISADAESYARFVDALDAKPAENPRLQQLMARKAPWE